MAAGIAVLYLRIQGYLPTMGDKDDKAESVRLQQDGLFGIKSVVDSAWFPDGLPQARGRFRVPNPAYESNTPDIPTVPSGR
jgi:hypothetical protein